LQQPCSLDPSFFILASGETLQTAMSFEALVDLLLAFEEEVSLEIEPAQMHAC
jgi:hypothetical protein